MTAAVKRRTPDPDAPFQPVPLAAGQVEAFPFTRGRCRAHPELALVTHKAAGLRSPYWGDDPRPVICPDLHHRDGRDNLDAYRCTWCGGHLHPPGLPSWRVSDRKTFCSPLCRLHHHRASRRAQP